MAIAPIMQRQALSLLLAILCGVVVTMMPRSARAETNITPSLLAETPNPKPGQVVTLAILMKPKPGWHGYWKTPGDAGFPNEYRWTLPRGASVAELRYPVPKRLVLNGLMNHVYFGDHALLTSMKIPAGLANGTRLPIRVKARWLACTDRICVPEEGEFATELVIGDGKIASGTRRQFDGWRQKLSRPLGSDAVFDASGAGIRLSIPLPPTVDVTDAWFFPETEQALSYNAPQKMMRGGGSLVIEASKAEFGYAPPKLLKGVLALKDGTGLEVIAKPGKVTTASIGDPAAVLTALGGALLGGFLLNIMPCVFPIISLKALSLARAGGDEARARTDALAYTAGAILTCMMLGGALLALRAGGTAVGWAFQLQEPWVIGVLLALSIAITLNLLGVFRLRGFGSGQELAGQGGVAGSFWTGALAAFVATPCTGPFMAVALGAALVLPTGAALAIFAGLGLGLALPFLAIGFVPAVRSRLPKPGAWMVTFQRWLALPMALTTLALVWLLWRQVGPPPQVGAGQVAFSESRLAELRAEGRPVFAYFTADWCATCKVNEAAAIDRDEVRSAFKAKNVAVMVGDWTKGDPAITRFLEAHGRSGVPLYLWYPAGNAAPRELPQLLTPGLLIALN